VACVSIVNKAEQARSWAYPGLHVEECARLPEWLLGQLLIWRADVSCECRGLGRVRRVEHSGDNCDQNVTLNCMVLTDEGTFHHSSGCLSAHSQIGLMRRVRVETFEDCFCHGRFSENLRSLLVGRRSLGFRARLLRNLPPQRIFHLCYQTKPPAASSASASRTA